MTPPRRAKLVLLSVQEVTDASTEVKEDTVEKREA